MISIDDYRNLVREVVGCDLTSNQAQFDAVSHEGADVLLIVAGPGSGKTTVLVLRALKHVFVDDILPEQLLITTFTRKAAKELRTRWLDWGTLLLSRLAERHELREVCDWIDLNRCRIDTLDSLSEQSLTENRLPGQVAPVVAEGSASKLILKRTSFNLVYTANKNVIDQFLARYTFEGQLPQNKGEALSITKVICERLIQDRIDCVRFSQASPAHARIVNIFNGYRDALERSNVFDFSGLEAKLLQRLQDGSLTEWLQSIHAILIDEYQDTNPLQEAIYFQLISARSPLVTVVGDDDQSMYRFRGGSVELFTQFGTRCLEQTRRTSRRINMVANYRSSEEIVRFYNAHLLGDPAFASARISPRKPEVVSMRGELGMPVLGMFRETPGALASALASWLYQLFEDREIAIGQGTNERMLTVSDRGDIGDCVLLAHTIEEIKYNRYNGTADTRFAGYFRNEMLNRGRHIFNPRGRSLRSIESVKQLLGLLLLCIDPDGTRVDQTFPTNEARFFLSEWNDAALNLIAQNPAPADSGGLRHFVEEWQRVSRGAHNDAFPRDWPALELIFKLVTWMPPFQTDPEHQVWLEAITRTLADAGMASPYGMQLWQIDPHRDRSRESLIRDGLLPIAENEVEVDEDIMPSVPRNQLQLMTIHQSKGLEFPVVIVDVGSQFTGGWRKQEFRRFPRRPSNVVTMEDDVEPYLPAPLRTGRSPIDRSFDDLVRLYYVAYSRPQSVLMLIGCEKCLNYGRGRSFSGAVPNIALGWNRNGDWPWRQRYTGRRAPIRVDTPMLLI